jgi:hypothetical protein
VGNPVSDTVTADAPGTYVVTQQLMAGCSVYATDTVVVLYDEDCTTLEGEKVDFKVNLKNLQPLLIIKLIITKYNEAQMGKTFILLND